MAIEREDCVNCDGYQVTTTDEDGNCTGAWHYNRSGMIRHCAPDESERTPEPEEPAFQIQISSAGLGFICLLVMVLSWWRH